MAEQLVHPNAEQLESATKGFDYLFSNNIVAARQHFAENEDPFHVLGQGVCAFLEAALGMESGAMAEASRMLALSEAGTRKQMKAPKGKYNTRFPQGLEWEILNADTVVLLGMTHALSDSYMGYLQCMYALNSAHSKFTKLYKTVFPNGIDDDSLLTFSLTQTKTLTQTTTITGLHPIPHKTSIPSIVAVSASTTTLPTPEPSFFSRWTGSASVASTPNIAAHHPHHHPDHPTIPEGPVEELIVSGTAFGFGLFNLVFSLLPKKVQGLVGFLGFKHDRKLALRALSVAASKKDVHGVFAGLVLMTYHGGVLLLSGYQADEAKILRQYKAIVDDVESRYPDGALWILNRAKIMRMSYDAEGAIRILQDAMRPERPHHFAQADMVLVFELAWVLLSQRRYEEAADTFIKITELNSWSHGTYYFIAAGCHVSLGNIEKAQAMFDRIPDLIDKRKINGKDLPSEVFIKKKLSFYKEKQVRRGGDEKKFAEAMKINPAEEISLFWNTHSRVSATIAEKHILEWASLSPPVSIPSPLMIPTSSDSVPPSPASSTSIKSQKSKFSLKSKPSTPVSPVSPYSHIHYDLDTPDELALRSLLLGINHRTAGHFVPARAFLVDAHEKHAHVKVNTWVGGVAMFELAVLDLKEVEARDRAAESGSSSPSSASSSTTSLPAVDGTDAGRREEWLVALKSASAKLDVALNLAPNTVDFSSRLDSRIAMLRDEIALKKEWLEIVG